MCNEEKVLSDISVLAWHLRQAALIASYHGYCPPSTPNSTEPLNGRRSLDISELENSIETLLEKEVNPLVGNLYLDSLEFTCECGDVLTPNRPECPDCKFTEEQRG